MLSGNSLRQTVYTHHASVHQAAKLVAALLRVARVTVGLDMWQDCQSTLQHTRPCYAKSSCPSVDPQTLHGNVHQVDYVPNGRTYSAAITTMFPLRLCGGKLLVAVTREQRYGPSRLRVNDNNDVGLAERNGSLPLGL